MSTQALKRRMDELEAAQGGKRVLVFVAPEPGQDSPTDEAIEAAKEKARLENPGRELCVFVIKEDP